jgi:hypothetical protein
MLFKNEEPFRLDMAPEKIKAIEKHFHGKFPVKVVYPPERIVKSRLPHNRLPDKPQSISFDLKAVVKTPNGTETWRYADNVYADNKGIKKYTPKKFIFNGTRWLDRNDIELIYFLLEKSEYCRGGKNEGSKVKFAFEDLVTEAEKKVEKKQLEAKIFNLLFHEDFALPEEKLRAVAMAYSIRNVETLTLPQVKMRLDGIIHATPDGADRFFKMIDADEEIKTRVSIQKIIDMELLRFDGAKRAWFWQTVGDKGSSMLCKVAPNKTPEATLYDLYMGDASFRDDVAAVLLSRDPNAGKPKTKGKVKEEIEQD